MLDKFVKQVIKACPKDVIAASKGKSGALQYLVGQIMRVSKGKADPKEAYDALVLAIIIKG